MPHCSDLEMSIFDKLKKLSVTHRQTEEALYSFVAQEMEDGIRHNGLWLKALERAGGDKEKQAAIYIKLRVQSLRDEMNTLSSPFYSGQCPDNTCPNCESHVRSEANYCKYCGEPLRS